MLNYINLKNVGGYAYKTLTIPMESGTLRYNIATQSSLGLPPSAVIFGIGYRIGDSQSKSINNLDLANFAVGKQTFLTLRDCETVEIFSNQPLWNGTEFGQLTSGVLYFEPRQVEQVDWERSFISIPQAYAASVKDNTDFELIIIYFDPACAKNVMPGHEDRTGFAVEGLRSRMVEIIQKQGVQDYAFAKNSTIGIPSDAIVVGIGLSAYNDVVFTGSTLPADTGKAFITLKRRTTIFTDTVPVEFGKSMNIPSMQKNFPKYLPLQPTLAGEIDWEGSQYKTLAPQAGASCVFTIYYVQPVFR